MSWQPIESAPPNELVLLYGYSVRGQAAPGGPYKAWRVTVGTVSGWGGPAVDLLEPGCDCIAASELDTPTHWHPLPEPPSA